MQAGRLRQRIKIYAVPTTTSATGDRIPATGTARTLICSAWAEVKRSVRLPTGSGQGEKPSRALEFQENAHEIHMRYFPGVTAAMEVDFAGRTFDVVDVDNLDNRNRELVLIAWEHFTSATP